MSADTVEQAVELIDYYKNHARRALGAMRAKQKSGPLARVLSYIENAPSHKVRPRNLIQAQIVPNAEEARAMLQKLADMGLGTVEGGRRKDEFIFQGRGDFQALAEGLVGEEKEER